MAANCKVIPLVWDWVAQKSLALSIGDLDLQPFIDEFNTVTGCKEVIPCHEEETEPCAEDEVYLCNFLIGTIDVATDPSGLTVIGAPVSRYTNGFPPYGVHWSWDPLIFSLVSGQGTPSVILQKLPGVAAGSQTTVSVHADDGNGCKDSGAITFGFPEVIADCGAAALVDPAMYLGIPYSGFLEVPYTGGNGSDYLGITVQSTGILGLTAVLAPGTLATGAGILTFTVTGTPQGNGTAHFALPLFGDIPCDFVFQVAQAVCQPTQAAITYHPFDFDNNWYPVEITWIPKADATAYVIEVVIGFGAPSVIVIPAPATSTFINVAPSTFFTVSVIVRCLFDSTPVHVSSTSPAAPAPCPLPTNLTASITQYDPIQGKFRIQLRWDIMTGATAYIVRDVNLGTSAVTGSRIYPVYKDPNTSNQFGVTVDCGNLVGEGPEALVSITTPPHPAADPSPWPVVHFMNNTSGQIISPTTYAQTWITVDGASDWVRIFQKSPFYQPQPGDNPYQADSGNLFLGADNGYLPLPPGFGSNDIFFGTPVPPEGLPIQGSALNFLQIAVVRGTSIPFQGDVTYFNYWMNVSKNYSSRSSNEDYISTDPSIQRPVMTATYPLPGTVRVNMNPAPFTYDACSRWTMILVSETGIVGQFTNHGTPMNWQVGGLAPGRYLVFGEITHNACVTPGVVKTALPIFITIA